MLTDPVQTQDGRHQPANGRQERKRLVGLPRAAVAAAEAQVAPVKRVAAAAAEVVDEQAEDGKPGDGEEEVGGPVDEGAREGQQPKQGEEQREAGDDLSIYEAAERPGGAVVLDMKVVACYASYDGGEDELESN